MNNFTKSILTIISILLIFYSVIQAQQVSEKTALGKEISLDTKMGYLKGTILVPDKKSPMPVALIIAGSGPTDRDGNNPMMTNNSLKMLAEALYKEGIASVRYDKRGIGESEGAKVLENNLRFQDYIDDAIKWILLLQKDSRFSKVIVIGHSEGSLIGMVAAGITKADAFVSAAGAGQPADKIIREQLKSQPASVTDLAYPILDSLVLGHKVKNVHPMLNPLFRESIQPYLISWIEFDPAKEISKLKIPCLILQGTTDIQVTKEDAKKLANANKKAKLVYIEGMNHVFKKAPENRQMNVATYNMPDLRILPEFTDAIAKFIKSLK